MPHKTDLTCLDAERKINLLIDGRLDLADRSLLDIHLATCDKCSGLLESYRRLSGQVSIWVEQSTSAESDDLFTAQVMASIAHQSSSANVKRESWAWVSVMGLAAIAVSVVFWREYSLVSVTALVSNPLPLTVPGSLRDVSDSLASLFGLAGQSIRSMMPNASAMKLPIWLLEAGAAALLVNAYFIARFGRDRVSG